MANWHTGEKDTVQTVGDPMDLAIGARQTWVMLDLLTKQGVRKVSGASTPISPRWTAHRRGRAWGDKIDGLEHTELERLIGLPVAL